MELSELIDEMSDIKRKLYDFDALLYDCEDIDNHRFDVMTELKDSAYENLTQIKDILIEIRRGKERY